ncbi:FAD-binding domain-containing protein [Dendrothele bispora CBS 962.96]|uniref:FAD-binding domain-containing protein n=1 Tax=Dendrothele bispora (strain CBS 962.96) TaxID=1314807 RepID=A0A4S8LUC1_DENBC|nr:FAD-binding domain-containing protein [Dendrothele bispora CBS 962.96]
MGILIESKPQLSSHEELQDQPSSFPFSILQSSFTGDLLTPLHSSYSSSITRWAINASRPASLVAYPKSPKDISLVMSFAQTNGMKLTVKGGGHSCMGASSVGEGGVVVDLQKYFGGVRVDEGKKLAYVGGGAVWKDVDKETMKYGLATVGGTVNHVSLKYTLGGGVGWLTGELGLSIDNLEQVTTFELDSNVVTTSLASHPDLFWALRGAGSNFGVVTEFVFRLHPQRKTVFSGFLIYPLLLDLGKIDEVFAATSEWWYRLKPGSTSNSESGENDTVNVDMDLDVIVIPFLNGPESAGKEIYKGFFDSEPKVNTTGDLLYEEMNALMNDDYAHGLCRYMRGFSQSKIDVPRAHKVAELIDQFNHPTKIIERGESFKVTVVYEYIPLRKRDSIPVEATAFPRDLANNGFMVITWERDTKENWETAKVVKRVDKPISSGELHPNNKCYIDVPNTHVGDAQENLDHRVRGRKHASRLLFGEDKYEKLQRIKVQCDPDNMFNSWFAIQPAQKRPTQVSTPIV